MKKSKWILLVEDDAAIAELTTLALDADKPVCNVIVARDGFEALEYIHHRGTGLIPNDGNPALVLLDLKMPRVNGFEVLRHIKSDASLKSIPIVMFTSSEDSGDIEQCYQLGANAYVVKPVGFQEFRQAIQRISGFWADLNSPPQRMSGNESRRPASGNIQSSQLAAA
jgi:CheY-like chemotaxis protein